MFPVTRVAVNSTQSVSALFAFGPAMEGPQKRRFVLQRWDGARLEIMTGPSVDQGSLLFEAVRTQWQLPFCRIKHGDQVIFATTDLRDIDKGAQGDVILTVELDDTAKDLTEDEARALPSCVRVAMGFQEGMPPDATQPEGSG